MKNKLFLLIPIVITFLIHCTFDIPDDRILTMTRIDNAADTLSVWPRLVFYFSPPLKDTIVLIAMVPDPGLKYFTKLSGSHDTLLVQATQAFEGACTYTLSLDRPICALNGSTLSKDNIQFRFFTYPYEQEPNNSLETTDTIIDCIYGSLFPSNDTDYIYIKRLQNDSLTLTCIWGRTGFSIVDGNNNLIITNSSPDSLKNYILPPASSPPLIAKLFSTNALQTRYCLRVH